MNPMLILPTPAESDLVPYSACAVLPARSVLVLAPHPDDEVFACGGAIMRHVGAGVPVSVLVLTDGALYGDASVRQLESRAAAKVLGTKPYPVATEPASSSPALALALTLA